jgi:hypothetical protein
VGRFSRRLSSLSVASILTVMHPDAPLRRITTWLAILGYTLVASGLPLPLGTVAPSTPESPAAKRLAGKDRSRPFPCMDKPCGCATAEQCLTNCCCNTPAETLAWAKAHRIEPAVLAALEGRVAGDRPAVVKATKSSCCSSKAPVAEESCCTSKQPAAVECEGNALGSSPAAVPTSTEAVARDDEGPGEDEPSHQPRLRAVTLRAMLACGGIVAEWCAAGAALPPPRVELSLAMRVLDVCTPADERAESLRASPAAPPPRVA